MFDFCPHCGQTIGQEQIAGRMLVCNQCGKDIGFVGEVQRATADAEPERAALCPICKQLVEVRHVDAGKKFVPHYAAAARKICPGSGKIVETAKPTPSMGKDLSAYMTRDVHTVIYCSKKGEPRIEVLTLDYLDKSERVRIQVEALREMLGPDFRLGEYPASLNRPHLAIWASADACVIARKHERGGFQSIADADIRLVLADWRERRECFAV